MGKIQIELDHKNIEVEEGITILEAAKSLGIYIPTLCHFKIDNIKMENRPGGCRICVVEIDGRRNLQPACAAKCEAGMKINTCSPRVLHARRTILELLISDHPYDCLICAKSGHCELQNLAQHMGVREIHYQGEQSIYRRDKSPSIIRDVDKCVMCRRCETMCNNVQTVGALSAVNRGFMSVVAPAFEADLEQSPCTFCGQCVSVCPTGALTEMDHTEKVIKALTDPTKTVVVQTAPAVRVALGEEFDMEPGTIVTGKMVAALRRMGFAKIFDTDFAADLTIMEEGTEMLGRLNAFLQGDKTVRLPILTSCCPAWVNFFEENFSDMFDVPSSAKSPQQMFGAIAKTYLAKKLGITKREDLVVVSVMPCLAKKYECQRDEFKVNGNPDVDIAITTRELAQLIRLSNIDLNELPDEDFDHPMGESTGAGVIFGVTGGVIEAATRTAYEVQTGKKLEKVEFNVLRGLDGVRSAEVDFDGLKLKIGIAHGLGNARKLLNEVREGKSQFHAIEIMACPGGCIGGGGQPFYHGELEILQKRAAAIYREDEGKAIRKSHENPDIIKLYEEFLGKPMSEKSHQLLHTHYFSKSDKN